jgi:hypothetical protein
MLRSLAAKKKPRLLRGGGYEFVEYFRFQSCGPVATPAGHIETYAP